jgi:poly(3-hydroxybutyrate) depolymerase
MDLTAEFYLQTVDVVFINHALPKGEMIHRGKPVNPAKISRCGLLTIEGENDDISGLGQTRAAHDLCSGLAEDKKSHYVQPNVGHYGVFNGSRFRAEIVPRIGDFILTHNRPDAASMPKPVRTREKIVVVPAVEPESAPAKPAEPGIVGEKVEAEPKGPVLLSEPRGAADDLKTISGIGPKLERILNENGIFHFWQVAALTGDQIADLETKLGFKGRVTRDDWIGQATRLSGAAV